MKIKQYKKGNYIVVEVMSFIYENFNNLCAIVVSNFQSDSQSDSSQYDISLQSDSSSQSDSFSQSDSLSLCDSFTRNENLTQSDIVSCNEKSSQSETSSHKIEPSPQIVQSVKSSQIEKSTQGEIPLQISRSPEIEKSVQDESLKSEKIPDNNLFDILNQKLMKDEIFLNIHNDSKLAKLIDILEETSRNILVVQKKLDSIRPRYSVNRKLYEHLWKRRIILENNYLLIKKAYLDRFFKLEIGNLEGPSIYLSASAD